MKRFNVGIIGMGGMGRQMLDAMAEHVRFRVVSGWDPAEESCNHASAQQPDMHIADSPEAVIADGNVDLVYVASPPKTHRTYVLKTLSAGKPIYCEKPLGIDIAESRDLVKQVTRSGLPNIINFNHAGALSATIVKEQYDAGQLGRVAGISMHLHVPQWPREFQVAAGWLKGREQGGYCREVFSHWIYLTHRILGDGTLKRASAHYPTDGNSCETFVQAELDFGGIPVSLCGITGGVGPVGVEYTLWAEKKSFRLTSGGGFVSTTDKDWTDESIPANEKDRKDDQRVLDAVTRVLEGEKSAMPDMRDGLAVQEVVEGILANSIS
jgi:1,5-anhydro-D-fructose reductase (1,5-anhydro-D-mannitol-forming)